MVTFNNVSKSSGPKQRAHRCAGSVDRFILTRSQTSPSTHQNNQQYSIYADSNSSGAVVERIAYTAYGQPTFMNAGTVQSISPNSIRYSYTGREWDFYLQLHHFRARWMGPVTVRFLSRDRILAINYFLAFNGNCLANLDPTTNQAVCSDLACTNHQGVYGLLAEGKTCHDCSSSGCCNGGMGDAHLEMIYVEYNDDAFLDTAQNEFQINGSVFATRSDSDCPVIQKVDCSEREFKS